MPGPPDGSRDDRAPGITFQPLTRADLPAIADWLARPHVAEWWGAPAPEEVEAEYGPVLGADGPVWCYFAYDAGVSVGFIQSYAPARCHDDGWWLDEHDPGVRGIDQFLADADSLGRGLGTRMVRAFLARLFADPAVTRVQTDPDPANARAIRCYEKSGFRASHIVDTPDGPALLMYAERPSPVQGAGRR